jgi:hypothetical protein
MKPNCIYLANDETIPDVSQLPISWDIKTTMREANITTNASSAAGFLGDEIEILYTGKQRTLYISLVQQCMV